jgi:hypothetical protein
MCPGYSRPPWVGQSLSSPDGIVVIQMSWWETTLFFAAVILAIWGFASLVGFRTRSLTRHTDRTAPDMYDQFADSARKQRKYARQHGGEWHSE